MDYQALKNELDLPAYAGMSDQEAADALNAVTVSVEGETMSAVDIFESITAAEFTTMAANKRANLEMLLSLGENIPMGPTSRARAVLDDIFGNGSPAHNNVVAKLARSVSRASQLNLGYSGEITVSHVINARAL